MVSTFKNPFLLGNNLEKASFLYHFISKFEWTFYMSANAMQNFHAHYGEVVIKRDFHKFLHSEFMITKLYSAKY